MYFFSYIFLVISFARHREYLICLASFGKFSDMLPAFTCTSVIGNLWSSFLGLNIVRFDWLETLARRPWVAHVGILGIPFPWTVLYLALDTIEE